MITNVQTDEGRQSRLLCSKTSVRSTLYTQLTNIYLVLLCHLHFTPSHYSTYDFLQLTTHIFAWSCNISIWAFYKDHHWAVKCSGYNIHANSNISLISYRNCLIFEVIGGNPITIIDYLLPNNIQLHLKLQITCRKNTTLGTLLTPRPIS